MADKNGAGHMLQGYSRALCSGSSTSVGAAHFPLSLPAPYRGAGRRFVEVAGLALFVLSCTAPRMRREAIRTDCQFIC